MPGILPGGHFALCRLEARRKISPPHSRSECLIATILVIGGQAVHRQSLAALLQRGGHRAADAPNGEKALEVVRMEKPDLVLTDVVMPDMDACELMIRLRAESGLSRPRVAFRATGYLEAEVQTLARACGVIHVVTWPAEPGALLTVVDSALSQPPPRLGEPPPLPGVFAAQLRSVARRLQQRVDELESLDVHPDRRMAQYAVRLEIARSALEQEVKKRISAEKELTEVNVSLHDQAVRDPLTGLYNRRYLQESLDREVRRARRGGLPVGLMMIDIDHFKRCNDTYGHAAGDAVLRVIGQYVLSLTRGEDILCRYGGEEFVLVMANATPRAVWQRAETLRLGVQKLRVVHNGSTIGPITVSVGIGMLPDHGESAQAVLQAGDAALYRAKQAGRNCIVMGDMVRA